jgi:Helicase associated domain
LSVCVVEHVVRSFLYRLMSYPLDHLSWSGLYPSHHFSNVTPVQNATRFHAAISQDSQSDLPSWQSGMHEGEHQFLHPLPHFHPIQQEGTHSSNLQCVQPGNFPLLADDEDDVPPATRIPTELCFPPEPPTTMPVASVPKISFLQPATKQKPSWTRAYTQNGEEQQPPNSIEEDRRMRGHNPLNNPLIESIEVDGLPLYFVDVRLSHRRNRDSSRLRQARKVTLRGIDEDMNRRMRTPTKIYPLIESLDVNNVALPLLPDDRTEARVEEEVKLPAVVQDLTLPSNAHARVCAMTDSAEREIKREAKTLPLSSKRKHTSDEEMRQPEAGLSSAMETKNELSLEERHKRARAYALSPFTRKNNKVMKKPDAETNIELSWEERHERARAYALSSSQQEKPTLDAKQDPHDQPRKCTGCRTTSSRLTAWERNMKDLLYFKEQKGHVHVPWCKAGGNTPLSLWAREQRRQHARLQRGETSQLTAQRVQELDALAFCWDNHEASWQECYHELMAYKQKYHHCDVPTDWPENPRLSTWVHVQRRDVKRYMDGVRSAMTEKHLGALREIGFN